MSCGMAEMRYLAAISGASSVLTLATLTLPWKSLAILSMVGANCRQGPHHTAQKSTSTGMVLLTTSCSQLSLVRLRTFSLAMSSCCLSLLSVTDLAIPIIEQSSQAARNGRAREGPERAPTATRERNLPVLQRG